MNFDHNTNKYHNKKRMFHFKLKNLKIKLELRKGLIISVV